MIFEALRGRASSQTHLVTSVGCWTLHAGGAAGPSRGLASASAAIFAGLVITLLAALGPGSLAIEMKR